jgi:DNA replication protein DnaC
MPGLPVSDPRFGQRIPCPDCGALAQRQHRLQVYRSKRDRIEKYTQKIGRYTRQTFDAFDQRESTPNTASIRSGFRAAWAFASKPQGWLVLYGPKGAGKSHLAAAIANHLESLPEEQRPLVMFLTAPDLLDLLRSGYNAGDYDELLNLCRNVDVLILDDLGVEQTKEWVTEKLFQILNHRYQAELPTVVISNHRLEELEPRLYDRLSDDDMSVRVDMLAPTYRQRRSSPDRIVQ